MRTLGPLQLIDTRFSLLLNGCRSHSLIVNREQSFKPHGFSESANQGSILIHEMGARGFV